MFAVVETGGKQYLVKKDDHIVVEKLPYKAGENFNLESVMLFSDEGGALKVGTPYVKGCSVAVTMEKEFKGEKLTIVKYKRRKNFKRTMGHRQQYCMLKVNGFNQ